MKYKNISSLPKTRYVFILWPKQTSYVYDCSYSTPNTIDMQEETPKREWEDKVPDVVQEEKDDKPAGKNIILVVLVAIIILAIVYYFFFRDSDNMFN